MAYKIVGKNGILCPRCGQRTQVRRHKRITRKQRAQKFYYERWFYCMNKKCSTTVIVRPEYRMGADEHRQGIVRPPC